jgi:hypothetical protein
VVAKSGCKAKCAVVFALEAQEDWKGEKLIRVENLKETKNLM